MANSGHLSEPPGPFPEQFAVTATHGFTRVRYIAATVTQAERWADERRGWGWDCTVPVAFHGDNVFSLEDVRKGDTA